MELFFLFIQIGNSRPIFITSSGHSYNVMERLYHQPREGCLSFKIFIYVGAGGNIEILSVSRIKLFSYKL